MSSETKLKFSIYPNEDLYEKVHYRAATHGRSWSQQAIRLISLGLLVEEKVDALEQEGLDDIVKELLGV